MTSSLLLAVAGATAATVTEALWALAVGRGVAIGRLVVLTTRGAKKRIGAELESQLDAMRRDFPRAELPPAIEWRVCAMEDIRTSDDNERLADWTLHQVAALAADESVTLHASLAGGRKTMGFALGAALQLVGRPQDRLYHVLVAPEFERPGFFYPTPSRSGRAAKGKSPIDLAEVPWVPLRGLLGDAANTGALTFRELVARASDALNEDTLDVHVEVTRRGGRDNSARIAIGSQDAPVAELTYRTPATREFVFYSWLLFRRHEGLEPLRLSGAEHFPAAAASLLDWSRHLAPEGGITRDIQQLLEQEWPEAQRKARRSPASSHVQDFLQEAWLDPLAPLPSRIAEKLRRQFADAAPRLDSAKYAVRNLGHATYEVAIPPQRIHFHFDLPEAA